MHPRLRIFAGIVELLSPTARSSVRRRQGPRRASGGTLRPGRDTPLWNQLAAEVKPLLKARGEKARLAHLLGLHRQAVNEFFASGSRMPDAERTLLLQEWVRARRAGKRLA
jgi:hypothetical protein